MFPFPDNPYLGQLHITDSALYRWNGLTWDRYRIGTSTTASTAPAQTPGEISLTALEARIRAIEETLETGLLLLE